MNVADLNARTRQLLSQPRTRKIGLWVVGIIVAIAVLGFLVVPPVAKSLLIDKLSEALHREVAIERIAVNPFLLTADVQGVTVKSREGYEMAGFDRLHVDLALSSLFRAAPVIEELTLTGPRVLVARLAENRYDISDLIDEWSAPKTPPPPEGPPPRFAVNNIRVENGKLVLDDRLKGVTHTVTDLKIGLPFISSLPSQTAIFVEPLLSANINGAPLHLKGKTRPFEATHESELALDLDHVDLVSYLAYLPVKLPFAVKSARLDSELKLIFRQPGKEPGALKLAGAAHLSDLALTENQGTPLIAWKRLDIGLNEVDLLNNKAAFGEIKLSGLRQVFRVDTSGRLNWPEMARSLASADTAASRDTKSKPQTPFGVTIANVILEDAGWHWREDGRPKLAEGQQLSLKQVMVKGIAIASGEQKLEVADVAVQGLDVRLFHDEKGLLTVPPSTPSRSDSPPWLVVVDKFALRDGSVRYEELSLKDKVVERIDGLQIEVAGLSTKPGARATVNVEGKVNQQGKLKVSGDLVQQPLKANFDLDVAGVPIVPAQPLFDEKLNVTFLRGRVSAKGKLNVFDDKGSIAGGFLGQAGVADLHAIDKINNTDLLRWRSLAFNRVDAQFKPLALRIGDIALSDFYARMIVTPEGKINLSQIVRQPEEAGPAASLAGSMPASGKATAKLASADGAEKPMLPVAIDRITFQNGRVNFSDLFVRPNYAVVVNKLNGSVKGLSSAPDSRADLELHGSYGNAAPVDILAKLNPLAANTYLDLKGEIRGVDLTTLSTYSGKYAGYAIEKGKLSLYVAYKLENSQLNAENRVFLDQLTFGDKVDSPDATTLPVKFAVALLKNSKGEIDINLPISGSLNDPQFSLGGVIIKVIVNLFVKAVTSPFALIGSMFGGGAELSKVEFEAGHSQLTPEATKTLETMAKAMLDRPALKLEVTGRANPVADLEGARRAALDRMVRSEKQKDLVKKGLEADSISKIQLDAKEYPEYLARVYKDAKFDKPRNFVGLTKGLPVEEMEKLLLAHTELGDEDFRRLAMRRGQVVQAWLVSEGKVPMERVFLLAPKVGDDKKGGEKDGGKGSPSRVDFSLQ